MELARALRAEAQRADERRVLVLAGDPRLTRERAATALAGTDIPAEETTVLGPEPVLDCERHGQRRAAELLGRTQSAVVVDAHEACRPNALGTAVGAVDGGGLVLLLTPPLDDWPARRDAFDDSLAVPPFDRDQVTGHFRRRLVETIRAHRGIGVVAVDSDGDTVEQSGLTDPPPRRPRRAADPPADHAFPEATYGACQSADQRDAVHALEALLEPGHAVVVEADRGRGKSSAAGLAAANLAREGLDVLVTAPQYRSAGEVFNRAAALLETLGVSVEGDQDDAPQRLTVRTASGDEGYIRYEPPSQAVDLPEEPDVVLVDEAAALPVRRLEALLSAPSVAFTTTVHGYEGAGRGFSVRFRDRLDDAEHVVTEVSMTEPIRYAEADPVEVWAFRALLLDARPPVAQVVGDATPETATYRQLTSSELLADEQLLREAFGLLVLAHYRTEPTDLARLLDAPNLTVRALTQDGEPSDARRSSSERSSDGGHVVAVALLAREGALDSETRERMYEGGRIRGNMLPDVLTTQLRDREAGVPVGQRVLRIATHGAVRSRGLGSKLLSEIRREFADDVDWLGVGFGATPELLDFWRTNGYRILHLSTSRNDRSGEYSAVMIDPCSDAGRELSARHSGWFCDRIGATLTDALDDAAPDVVRGALAAADAEPSADLSAWEWRLVAGLPTGASILDTNPAPFRRLALRHFVAPADPDALSTREERLLVRKVLQARPWTEVATEMEFVSERECKRAVGSAVETLTRLYREHP
ncbi:GNAT family N-acetyltransferase [Halomicroarcula sp. F28]|uniref:tRNA(Met) cytidine acetyltransferase TmcA n=1 Tax=Haloarcula salinisoli TaxID=2487746 RepID=UPI001C733E05|nr:tRNA(Met) cytidine acetyltransferase TmcA [Halomicroarcula salinisoli]MBX0285285.1 GNAT family N-acetyltransferase [Halomicroarcula salinisoli]